MAHKADSWIASQWMGKEVRQERGSPDCIGRVGKVEETMWDEKGALHCRMVHNSMHGMTSEWWCPAALLEFYECGKCPACGKPLQDDVCQNTECDS